MRIPLLFLIAWLSATPQVWCAEKSWLFAALLEEKQILSFERDQETGELTRRAVTRCSAEPACMAVSRDHKTLFVAYRSSGQLASFRIDWNNGALTVLSVVAAGDDPAFLLNDRTGRYLLSAYYQSNKVAVHAVSSKGEIGALIQSVPTAPRAHGLALDSTNKRLYTPHTGANRIYQFRFDQQTGRLGPMVPPYVAAAKEDQPRHLVLHPNDRWAYTSNEAGDSIGVYGVDDRSGSLRPLQTHPTIPADFDGAKNSTSRCEMTPNGRFVYVANRGHNSIAGFAIDPTTGKVSPLGQTKTETTPRSFTIDSSGRFLYAAGQASGKIAAYRIGDDGRLTRFATYPSGPVSWWVLLVDPLPPMGE